MLGDIIRAAKGELKPKDDGIMLFTICGVLAWSVAVLAWVGVLCVLGFAFWGLMHLATYFLGAW
jgi:hypothetical protein